MNFKRGGLRKRSTLHIDPEVSATSKKGLFQNSFEEDQQAVTVQEVREDLALSDEENASDRTDPLDEVIEEGTSEDSQVLITEEVRKEMECQQEIAMADQLKIDAKKRGLLEQSFGEAERLHVNVDFAGCQKQIKHFIKKEFNFVDVNNKGLKTCIGYVDSLDALPAQVTSAASTYRQCFQDLKTPGYVYLWTQQLQTKKKGSNHTGDSKTVESSSDKSYGKYLATIFPAPVGVAFLKSAKVRENIKEMTENVLQDWKACKAENRMAVPSRTVTVMERDNKRGDHCAIFLQSSLFGYVKSGRKGSPTRQDVRVTIPLGTNADEAMSLNNPTNRVRTENGHLLTRLTSGYSGDSSHFVNLLSSKPVQVLLQKAQTDLKF